MRYIEVVKRNFTAAVFVDYLVRGALHACARSEMLRHAAYKSRFTHTEVAAHCHEIAEGKGSGKFLAGKLRFLCGTC